MPGCQRLWVGGAAEADARDQDAGDLVASAPGSPEHRTKMQVPAERVFKVNSAEEHRLPSCW